MIYECDICEEQVQEKDIVLEDEQSTCICCANMVYFPEVESSK